MRYAGWYPRRRGILEHLDKGTISLLDLAVHDFLCLICDHETGVAYASSEKIHALCPVEINARAIRRSLAKMERIGWIKRFCVRGRRGNYPILIAKYFVRDTSGNWMSVNAEKTTDLREIQFDAVHDVAFSLNRADRHRVSEPVSEMSGIQEVRAETEETRIEKSEWNGPDQTGAESEKYFDGFELKISSDLLASLWIEAERLKDEERQVFERLRPAWNRSWKNIKHGKIALTDWIASATDELKRVKVWYPPILERRMHELQDGRLRVLNARVF